MKKPILQIATIAFILALFIMVISMCSCSVQYDLSRDTTLKAHYRTAEKIVEKDNYSYFVAWCSEEWIYYFVDGCEGKTDKFKNTDNWMLSPYDIVTVKEEFRR